MAQAALAAVLQVAMGMVTTVEVVTVPAAQAAAVTEGVALEVEAMVPEGMVVAVMVSGAMVGEPLERGTPQVVAVMVAVQVTQVAMEG